MVVGEFLLGGSGRRTMRNSTWILPMPPSLRSAIVKNRYHPLKTGMVISATVHIAKLLWIEHAFCRRLITPASS